MKGVLLMTTFSAGEIAEWTGGSVEREGAGDAHGVSTDTRTLGAADLFVALKGPRYDAHDFLGEALEKGAWGLLVEKGRWSREEVSRQAAPFPDRTIVVVDDTERALGDLAASHRSRLDVKVIAITGSNGKTTTKEMTAAIAGERWDVHKTRGNFNNLIGLPLTVLGLEERHQTAVLEMGMNRRGEIRRLAEIARPDVGVVTTVGPVHLEHLGGIEDVAAAKAELVDAIGTGGTAVLNADDPRVAALALSTQEGVLTFGLSDGADFRAEEVTTEPRGTSFLLSCPAGKAGITIPFFGEHNVRNALAAAAAAYAVGAGLEEMVRGLESVLPVPMRFTLLSFHGGTRVVNDAYNANPDSMRAALRSLRLLPGGGRRAAVLGDMLELGEESARAHRDLGAEAAAALDFIVAVGRFADETVRGAIESGFDRTRIRSAPTCRDAAEILKGWILPGDLILLKGSRGVALEEVLRLLQSEGVLRRP